MMGEYKISLGPPPGEAPKLTSIERAARSLSQMTKILISMPNSWITTNSPWPLTSSAL
jgi:hypothetical protein